MLDNAIEMFYDSINKIVQLCRFLYRYNRASHGKIDLETLASARSVHGRHFNSFFTPKTHFIVAIFIFTGRLHSRRWKLRHESRHVVSNFLERFNFISFAHSFWMKQNTKAKFFSLQVNRFNLTQKNIIQQRSSSRIVKNDLQSLLFFFSLCILRDQIIYKYFTSYSLFLSSSTAFSWGTINCLKWSVRSGQRNTVVNYEIL